MRKDVIYLQEVKATIFQASSIMKFIWDQDTCFVFYYEKGKGGVSMLIGPKWSDKITSHGDSPCHRAYSVTFKVLYRLIGIYNIYVANDYREIVSL